MVKKKHPGRPPSGKPRMAVITFKVDGIALDALDVLAAADAARGVHSGRSELLRRLILDAAAKVSK